MRQRDSTLCRAHDLRAAVPLNVVPSTACGSNGCSQYADADGYTLYDNGSCIATEGGLYTTGRCDDSGAPGVAAPSTSLLLAVLLAVGAVATRG